MYQNNKVVPRQWHVPRESKIKPVLIIHIVVARPTESRKKETSDKIDKIKIKSV
jgi:hypothetical protein